MVLSGPLQEPIVAVDAKGAALGAADVGVAVASAGLSRVGGKEWLRRRSGCLRSRLRRAVDAEFCGRQGSA
jgi:hypothetical protein